jgi:hypothetical protein
MLITWAVNPFTAMPDFWLPNVVHSQVLHLKGLFELWYPGRKAAVVWWLWQKVCHDGWMSDMWFVCQSQSKFICPPYCYSCTTGIAATQHVSLLIQFFTHKTKQEASRLQNCINCLCTWACGRWLYCLQLLGKPMFALLYGRNCASSNWQLV